MSDIEAYDLVDGQRRYALVDSDNNIKAISYHNEKPTNGDWRPVEHEDSETFDDVRHWRLAPIYTIEPARVLASYPVVAKETA